jgi:3-oxoacyl-[acyl-carrier protein] reductase
MKIVLQIERSIKRLSLILHVAKHIHNFGDYKRIRIAELNNAELLRGKNILITGGSTGIGLSIAKKSLKCGANVIITGRDENKLIETTKSLGSSMIQYVVWDVQDVDNMKTNLLKAINLFENRRIDILINNAGVGPSKYFPQVDEKEWDRIYNTNSKGLFFLSQEICKLWMQCKNYDQYKKIINISSQGGCVGATYPYRMTKWDVRGFTQGLALEMIDYGIIVNGIAPGIVATSMQPFVKDQKENVCCSINPIKRFAMPEEISELAVFLMSDCSNFIVGQTIVCDGGYSLK